MRRAERLFQIIEVFCRARGPVTADAIAEEIETSKRTVYRDIAALIGQRVPARGERRRRLVLDSGHDLPPLMLTREIEAAVAGAQWVIGHADPALAKAAKDLMAKIGTVVSERLRAFLLEPAARVSRPEAARLIRSTLRQDFRHFRTDRIVEADFRDERYLERPASLRAKWLKALNARIASKAAIRLFYPQPLFAGCSRFGRAKAICAHAVAILTIPLLPR